MSVDNGPKEGVMNHPTVWAEQMPFWDDIDFCHGWDPGAADNIFLHHGTLKCSEHITNELADLLQMIAAGDEKAKEIFCSLIAKWRAIHVIDPLMQKLFSSKPTGTPASLRAFAQELVFEADKLELVKVGIALLGATGCTTEEVRLIKKLGLREELTSFVVLSLNSLLEDADLHIWEIAQNTYGWGRINCVEQLKNTKNLRIKHWLFSEGYNNTISNGYTALICALSGEMADILDNDKIKPEYLNAACGIIGGLLQDECTGGIDDYPDAFRAVSAYVHHVSEAGDLCHFALLIRLARYIENPFADWSKRAFCGWEKNKSKLLLAEIKKILGHSCFKRTVLSKINEDSDDLLLAANYLGLDRWEANFNKLKSNPLNPSYWKAIFHSMNKDRVPIVDAYFRESVNWVEYASRLESGSYAQLAVDEILKGIKNWPGLGKELLIHTLSSTQAEHRKASQKVLSSWGKAFWPEGAENFFKEN